MKSPVILLFFVLFVTLCSGSEGHFHKKISTHHLTHPKVHHKGHHKNHHRKHSEGLTQSHYKKSFNQKLVRDSMGVTPLVPQEPKYLPVRASRNRRDQATNLSPTSVINTANGISSVSHNGTASPTTDEVPKDETGLVETKIKIQNKDTSIVPPIIPMACQFIGDCTNLTNSICDAKTKTCICDGELSVRISTPPLCTNPAVLNATCEYDAQCLSAEEFSACDAIKKICLCLPGYEMKEYPDVGVNCVTKSGKPGGMNVDPTMIGVLAALALMFIIICVVLRLFSKARFRETRSIFNTPNPRLMNASLFKDSKLLSPARGDRRGSRASVRSPPSRAPSVTSVNMEGRSLNGSLAKGRRSSVLSTASATGSVAAAAIKTPSPKHENKNETTVAIEAVD